MLRLNHALPLALLVSVSAFAMQPKMKPLDGHYYKDSQTGKLVVAGAVEYRDAEGHLCLADTPKGEIIAKEVTVIKPAMAITWANQDGKYVPTEGTEVSKALTQAERPVALMNTMLMGDTYTKEQSVLNKLQEEKDAALRAEANQIEKLKAMSTELARKISAKQAAEVGNNLNIADLDNQIAKMKATKETEIATQKQTATDIKVLQEKLNQTARDVATAEAAKKAADAANKKSWSLFGWSKSTPAPVATAMVAPAAAEITITK